MNRKQRRAGLKQTAAAGGARGQAAQLFADALRAQQQNKLDEAARAYKRLLLLMPDHAQASNNLACVLQAQGKLAEASARFARTLELVPLLLDQFGGILSTLISLQPALGVAVRRAVEAWPQRLPLDRLLDENDTAVLASDPLLLTILRSTPVRDVALERLLTTMRAALLDEVAGGGGNELKRGLCCALAQQCFINEYVFATTPAEDASIERIKGNLIEVSAIQLAALAMYLPLHSLADAQALCDRTWPDDVEDIVTQQVREPLQELALRNSIQQVTPVEDLTSQRVRQQYEENPYPRWVHVASSVEPQDIDAYLRTLIPQAPYALLGQRPALDVLVAGSGTGVHPIEFAQKITGARVLAVDLSLASLAYAKRKTPAGIADRISYAQGDILKLGNVDRSFDVIDASGVLHHMADPAQGLRCLIDLLRAGGLMHLGLYSEPARRDVTAARKYLAEKGYLPTADGIRRARQDILDSNLRSVARTNDFFSMSECRDLLFHVQEHQFTIPKIRTLLADAGLMFIGFVFGPALGARYAALFAEARQSMSDLDAWHLFEQRNPDTFLGMYQFWVQKP
jgi:SAM-dependent methyltransferase